MRQHGKIKMQRGTILLRNSTLRQEIFLALLKLFEPNMKLSKKGFDRNARSSNRNKKKTGGGLCPVALTPSEEKVLSLTPNTMVGLPSRFDKDYSEPGPSGIRQWVDQEDEGDEQESSVANNHIIEVIDDENEDLLEYLNTITNTGISQAASGNSEQSTILKKKGSKRKISSVDLEQDDTPTRGTDSKFIFKNKRARRNVSKDQILGDSMQLKNKISKLQKDILIQEIQAKSEINKLTIQNLKITQQLFKQKLEQNVAVDDNFSDY